MAAWMLNEAICPMNEGSEAREFSGRELWWWGLRVGGGLLGVPVVSGWLLGTPVVGLFGGAVAGSSLGSLRICDSRGTLAASVDVVVVSVGTTWARSARRAMWTWGCGFGLWLPCRGERLPFLGLWATQWNSWWGRGGIRASSISIKFHAVKLVAPKSWSSGNVSSLETTAHVISWVLGSCW